MGVERSYHARLLCHISANFGAESSPDARGSGWDMEQIRRQLGHSSLAVTGQYLDHIGANELSDKMRGEDWGL